MILDINGKENDMDIRKKRKASMENMTLGRVMVTIGVLALLSISFGCQAPGPYKMYSGPELESSQVALIRAQGRRGKYPHWYRTYILAVDGHFEKLWGLLSKTPTELSEVLVLPGEHKVEVICSEFHGGEATAALKVMVEAGKTYEVKALATPNSFWSCPTNVEFWIEDVETGSKVSTLIRKYPWD